MENILVIVESPAKCKKIAGFLGPGYTVLATMGHIRALDEDLDAVGLDRDFEPRFRFLAEKSKATKPILDAAKSADKIYLAADDDREGEAIAYSVACLLKRDPLSFPRAVFHEITAKAVRDAIQNPRRIDINRVMAQQARSVLDMMVGFTISPVLWKHVARTLSAGRCQTPALRLVYEREQASISHTSQTTWGLQGEFQNDKGFTFTAKMEDDLEDQDSAVNYMENIHTSNKAIVKSVQQKPWTANPPKPLITSTLQQEASALHGVNPKSTMKIAQMLYEAGHITYMRTDHAVLSEEAITNAHQWIRENHGEAFLGTASHCRSAPAPSAEGSESSSNAKPKKGKKKEKEAESTSPPTAQESSSQAKKTGASSCGATAPQEAHEAIRPTHMEHQELTGDWTPLDRKIYGLIWRRAVQACMSPAKGQTRTATLTLQEDADNFPWSVSWKMTEFQGWQVLGSTAKLDDDSEDEIIGQGRKSTCGENSNANQWKQSLQIKENTPLTWSVIQANPKSTKAQPRFNEATLIRELEHKGIGRPSTFASLVETLFDKKYVEKKDIPGSKINHTTISLTPTEWPPITTTKQVATGVEKNKLAPTALGESVLTFCIREFPQLFAYDFTAQMENRLDSVAKGEEMWKQVCRDTWSSYKDKYNTLMDKGSIPSNSEKVKEFCGGLKAVLSKNGLVLVQEKDSGTSSPTAKGKSKGNVTFYAFPQGYTIQTITEEVAREHIKSLTTEDSLGMWGGQPILKKKGPYGLYIQCGSIRLPYTESESLEAVYEKIRSKQVSMDSQVRVGGYVFARGQYGPYMYKDGLKTKNFVGVPDTIDPKTLTLADAEALYKQCSEAKKSKGGWRPGGDNRGGNKGGKA
jgi:DNA topoisomerase-1